MSARFRTAFLGIAVVLALVAATPPAIAQTGTVGLNFTGLTKSVGAALNSVNGYAPPDNNGAVGHNEIVQLNNGAYSIYSKTTGALLEPRISGRQFWINAGVDPGNGLGGLGAFNARILFDPSSDRWFAAELSGQSVDNSILVARSNTSNPLDGWKAVSFLGNAGGDGKFVDYTRLGLDANGVYISTNNFTSSVGDADSMSLFSLPKADLLAANPTTANLTRFDAFGLEYGWSMQPIVDFGPAKSNAPLLATSIQNDSTYLFRADLFGTSGPGATITPNEAFVFESAEYHMPPAAAQPDGTRSVGTTDHRFGGTVVQIGDVIYAVHNTKVDNNAAISWLKIDEQTNQILQEGVISDPNFDYFLPSIAANANGDIVIGFTRSGLGSDGQLSDFAVVGKTTGNSISFGAPILLKASSVNNYHYLNSRWGDYSTTVVDPDNPNVFWTFQQYATSSNDWATQITQITVPEPSTVVLGAAGLAALVLVAWRRRARRP